MTRTAEHYAEDDFDWDGEDNFDNTRFHALNALENDEFYGCCGIYIVAEFMEYTKVELIDSIKEHIRYASSGKDWNCDPYALIMATTVPRQRSAIAALKECGFEHMPPAYRAKVRGKNNHHKTSITVWYKYLGRRA